jgi:xanthine dehydrogenase large subunit
MGWCTTEDLRYDQTGRLLTTSPTTYKIPSVTDVPKTLNIAFLHNPKHQVNVGLSKAVGEPPLLLGISAWAAVKHALGQAHPRQIASLRLPATNEEILMCLTRLAADERPLPATYHPCDPSVDQRVPR